MFRFVSLYQFTMNCRIEAEKSERANGASIFDYSGLRYPILVFSAYGRGSPDAITVPLPKVRPMHPRLISVRPTSVETRWLCHLTHDLKQRLTCSSPLHEYGNGYAIAPLAHATPRLKVRVSPLRHRRERSRAAAKSTSPFVRFPDPPESFRFLYLSRRTSSP